MEVKWCPYLGEELPKNSFNEEHIIPLSLGGSNKLTIEVEKNINAELGRKLDSEIGKTPIISSARRHHSLKGQSKRKPKVVWPLEHKGLKGRLDLTPEQPVFSTFRSHNEYGLNLIKNLSGGEKLRTSFSLDENLILSFGAKIALGVGYYLYSEIFRDYGYHAELRKLMNSDKSVDALKFIVSNNKGKGFWGLSWPRSLKTSKVFPPWFDAILDQNNRNVIFTLHTTSEIIIGISILSGFYRWYFNLSNDSDRFPIGGEFELGAAIEINLNDRAFVKKDLRSYLEDYITYIYDNLTNQ